MHLLYDRYFHLKNWIIPRSLAYRPLTFNIGYLFIYIYFNSPEVICGLTVLFYFIIQSWKRSLKKNENKLAWNECLKRLVKTVGQTPPEMKSFGCWRNLKRLKKLSSVESLYNWLGYTLRRPTCDIARQSLDWKPPSSVDSSERKKEYAL